MGEVIFPLENTYLKLLPIELRKLLYFFKNTIEFSFKIQEIRDHSFVVIRFHNIGWFHMTLFIEKYRIKPHDLSDFIIFIKHRMALIPTGPLPTAKQSISINDITDLNMKYQADFLLVAYHTDMRQDRIKSTIALPLCTELLQLLEQINVLLK